MMPYDNWFKGKNAKFRFCLGIFIGFIGGALFLIDWLFELVLG